LWRSYKHPIARHNWVEAGRIDPMGLDSRKDGHGFGKKRTVSPEGFGGGRTYHL